MDTQTVINVPVPIEQIDPNPYQPRQVEDPAVIAEIAESIRKNGLMQVPTARRVNGHYQLAFGHTRLAAFKLLQETTMPLNIRELTDLQMFELGVSENIKRRDLNPIELADSMKRYMQEFQKNSVETGEFFNVSPEKVRNTVRLLNLPKDLQSWRGRRHDHPEQRPPAAHHPARGAGQAPDGGQQARPPERRSRPGDRRDPEELQPVCGNVAALAGWGTAGRQPSLEDLHAGREVPEQVTARAQGRRCGQGPGDRLTNRIWKTGSTGRSGYGTWIPTGSGFQKGRVDVTECMVEVEPRWILEKIVHLLNPPGCSACPFYAKVDGSHYCSFKFCHSRKTHAWEEHLITSASKKTGIAIYNKKADGSDASYLTSYDPPDKKLWDERNADLRIKKGTNWAQHFEDIPAGYSVVVVGETLKKMRKADAKKHGQRDTNSEEYNRDQRRLAKLRDANENALYDFIWNVVTPAFQTVFNGANNLGFFEELSDHFCSGVPAEEPDKKAPRKEKIEFYQKAILFSIFDDDLWEYKTNQKGRPVRELAKHLQGVAKTWGIELPKDWMTRATEADKAITVSTETAEEK